VGFRPLAFRESGGRAFVEPRTLASLLTADQNVAQLAGARNGRVWPG
jgi:hypothetical protein